MPEALAIVAVCGGAYACGRYLPPLAGGALVIAAAAILALASQSPVPFILATAAPWFAGWAVRSRHELLKRLRRRTRELEAEQDALAALSVQRERSRIARELHDIVAHHLAVIVVQAGAGRMAPDSQGDASERFKQIRQSGEEALSEMDRLVDLLQERPGDSDLPAIDVLVEKAEASGVGVTATPLPADLSMPAAVEQLATRIVREGLTNAMKHAPGCTVALRFSPLPGELAIELHSHGGSEPTELAGTGSGMGIQGLRERVEEAGGSLDAAPAPDGWLLRAAIPLR